MYRYLDSIGGIVEGDSLTLWGGVGVMSARPSPYCAACMQCVRRFIGTTKITGLTTYQIVSLNSMVDSSCGSILARDGVCNK